MLGLLVTDIENPFFPHLVRAVEDAARSAGYGVLLCNSTDDPEREAGYLTSLVDRRVDGIIVATSSISHRHADWLRGTPVPVVVVNGPSVGLAVPAVASDNRTGGRIAVDHLLSLGHRHVAFLTAPSESIHGADRLAGALEAVASHGLPDDMLRVIAGPPTVVGGELTMRTLLKTAPEITGVFAYNDLMAIGVIRAIRESGRRVPADISVVGFDDVSLAAYTEPALTTVAQGIGEMGRRAFEILAGRLDGETAVQTRDVKGEGAAPFHLLPVALRVRGSTAPPRGADEGA